MIVIEKLPLEFLAVLNSEEFDDEAGILIESVEYFNDDLNLRFSVNYLNDMHSQMWMVKVEDVKDERIIRNWTQTVELYQRHPLLLKYIDIYTELYFNGRADKSGELFIDILIQSINYQIISRTSYNMY